MDHVAIWGKTAPHGFNVYSHRRFPLLSFSNVLSSKSWKYLIEMHMMPSIQCFTGVLERQKWDLKTCLSQSYITFSATFNIWPFGDGEWVVKSVNCHVEKWLWRLGLASTMTDASSCGDFHNWRHMSLQSPDCSRNKHRASRYPEPGWLGSEGRAQLKRNHLRWGHRASFNSSVHHCSQPSQKQKDRNRDTQVCVFFRKEHLTSDLFPKQERRNNLKV